MSSTVKNVLDRYKNDTSSASSSQEPVGSSVSRTEISIQTQVGNTSHSAQRVFLVNAAGGPSRIESQVTPFSRFLIQFRPRDRPARSERCGRPDVAFIMGVKVHGCWNTMPYPVIVRSSDIRGRYYGPSDMRGFFGINPNYNGMFSKPISVMLPEAGILSKSALKYASLPMQDVPDDIVAFIDTNKYKLVKGGTAHHRLLLDNAASNGYDVARMLVTGSTDFYAVPRDLYRDIDDTLQREVKCKIATVDMLNMWFCFKPVMEGCGSQYMKSSVLDSDFSNIESHSCGLWLEFIYHLQPQ